MSTKSLLLTVIGGAVAGAAAAVLLAPDSGKGTRKKLMKSATDAKDSIEGFLMNAGEQITQWCEKTDNKDTSKEAHASLSPGK